MASSAAMPRTSFAGRKTSFAGAAIIPPPEKDAQEIVEALVILGGVRVLGHVRQLVERFRSAGYPEAAARWDTIATIVSSTITEESVGGSTSHRRLNYRRVH